MPNNINFSDTVKYAGEIIGKSGKIYLVLASLGTLVLGLIPAGVVWGTAFVVGAFTQDLEIGQISSATLQAMIVFIAIMLVAEIVGSMHALNLTLMGARLGLYIQEKVLQQAVDMPLSDFENSDSYNSLQRASQESSSRPYQVLLSLQQHLIGFISIASLLFLVMTWSPVVAALVLIAPVLDVIIQVIFAKIRYGVEFDRAEGQRKLSYFHFLLTKDMNFQDTRIYGTSKNYLERTCNILSTFYHRDRDVGRKELSASVGVSFLASVASLVALYVAGMASIDDASVAQFAGFIAAMSAVQAAARDYLRSFADIYENLIFMSNLVSFFKMSPAKEQPGGSLTPSGIVDSIQVKNVSFTYPGASQPTLSSLNLDISKGEVIGLVGSNGAGKSTLIKLLCGFYEPSEGEILVDGLPLTKIDKEEWRNKVAVVLQNFIQYEDSLGFNVACRDDWLTSERRLHDALDDSGASDFVSRYEMSGSSILGKWFGQGRQLSGGEWQKIALARSLYRDSTLRMFDEPTSAIDAASEASFYESIFSRRSSSCTLIVTHRLGALKNADKICVLSKGRITEIGSHSDLLELQGEYARMIRSQL